MHIDIQARPFPLSEGLLVAARGGLRNLQRRHGEQISRITVRLDDINGRRGGVDMRCQVMIHVRGGKTIFAQALSADMYDSIALATRRAETALGRARARRWNVRARFKKDHACPALGVMA